MTTASLATMSEALTAAYKRGLETITIPLGAVGPTGEIPLGPYDYQDYQDRYGRMPDSPRYLLVASFAPTEPLDVTVTFRRAPGMAVERATVHLAPSSIVGRAHSIPTGEPSTATLRIVSLLPSPDPPPGASNSSWRVIALLGNLAKLLWVMGAEHEELAAHAAEVARHRSRVGARGSSLDLLGVDLGVPRFPPVAYSFDDDTIALYHLDDVPPIGQAEPPTVFDEVERHRPGAGHAATNVGQVARSRSPGRFAFGFAFRAGAGGPLEAPDHVDFAVPAAQGLTVEATVLPTARTEAAMPGTIVVKRNVLNVPAEPGWGLAIGSFRAIDNNVRFAVSDGVNDVTLFADRDLADGVFHHVAGTVERRGAGAMVSLWVDGRTLASRRVAILGALTSAAPMQIGRGREQPAGGGGTQPAEYEGVIDEVRISRSARRDFSPAVGESDDDYRRRLGIFERWQLPSPKAIVGAINELVQVSRAGQSFSESFVIVEDDNDVALGTRALEVVPRVLSRGIGIASDGRLGVTEADIAGTPEDDPTFDAVLLVRHDHPRVVYPGEAQRRMQRSVAEALDALLTRLGATTLRIHAGYDPSAVGDLSSIGRALEITVDALDSQAVAAEALLAGFDFVMRTRTDRVRVAQGAREALAVTAQPASGVTPPPASDVGVGDPLMLSMFPSLPSGTDVRWVIVACGHGEAFFVDGAGASSRRATGPTPNLQAHAAGDVAVRVEATVHGRRATGTRTLRIGLPFSGPNALPAGASIGGNGQLGVTEEQATAGPQSSFHPVYLACHAAPNVDYGGNVLNRRMQRSVATALDGMRAVLGGGTLRVEQAYDPTANDLHAEGRAVRISHSSQPGPALAAAAFAGGFDFIRRLPNDAIHVSMAPAELVDVETSTSSVHVDDAADLAIRPQSQPNDIVLSPDGRRVYVANLDSSTVTAVSIPDSRLADLRAVSVEGVALVDLNPRALILAPNGQRLWTISEANGTVSVVATQPFELTSSFATGLGPVDLSVRPDGARVYVACAGDSTVRVHDAQSGAQLASVAMPARPVSIAMAPNGAQAWVACQAPSVAVVIDLQTNAISGATIGLSSVPAAIEFAPGGVTAYIALPAERRVLPVDGATRALGAPIDVECAATRLSPSPDGQLVWVASEDDAVLRAVRTATNTLDPTRIRPGLRPSGITARAATGASRPAVVVCCGEGDSQLTFMDPSALGTPRSPIVLTSPLGAGAGERLHWTTVPADFGDVRLTSTVAPALQALGVRSGRLLVRALYSHSGKTNPYEFELRLRSELDHDDVVIRKAQYDIVMNILNALHPIGVEVRTENVRAHVIEVREGLADAFPGYTYPNFRTGSITLPTPRRRT